MPRSLRRFARNGSIQILCIAFLTACAGQTPPPPPAKIVTVYPKLPSTTCRKPIDLPASTNSPDKFAEFLNSVAGRAWLRDNGSGYWECFISSAPSM